MYMIRENDRWGTNPVRNIMMGERTLCERTDANK